MHSVTRLPGEDCVHTGLLKTPTQTKKTLLNLFIMIKTSAAVPCIRMVHYVWSSSSEWLSTGGDPALQGTARRQPLPRTLRRPRARLTHGKCSKLAPTARPRMNAIVQHTYSPPSKCTHGGEGLAASFSPGCWLKTKHPPMSPSLRPESHFRNPAVK